MLNATKATQVTFLGEFISRGRRWNAYSDGTILPVIAGGDGTGGDGGQGGAAGGQGATGAAGTAGTAGTAGRTFTQDDMNATVARAETAAKAKAEQDLATLLGVPLDEAKQIIADRRAADDAKRTEAERAAAAWQTAQQGAETIKGEAERERHEAKVERALGRAGLDVDNDAILRAGLAVIDVAVGADGDAIKAAVEKAKADAPQLFGTTTGGGTHSDAGGQRRDSQAPSGEFGTRGAAEAERRWGKQGQQQSA